MMVIYNDKVFHFLNENHLQVLNSYVKLINVVYVLQVLLIVLIQYFVVVVVVAHFLQLIFDLLDLVLHSLNYYNVMIRLIHHKIDENVLLHF